MRGLLDAMPAYASRDTRVRVAKQYTAQDLVVVRTCSQLESRYGLQRSVVAAFSGALQSVLSGPRPVSANARLLLTFDPTDVRYLDATENIEAGLLVPLAPIFMAVDEYLLPGRAQINWSQRELGFGLHSFSSVTLAPAPTSVTAQSSSSAGHIEPTRRKQ